VKLLFQFGQLLVGEVSPARVVGVAGEAAACPIALGRVSDASWPSRVPVVLILQQLQVAGDPVDVHGSRWTHGQHSLGVRLDLGATGVAYEARVQLLALGCLLNGHQLRLALNPHSDFGASAVLPRP